MLAVEQVGRKLRGNPNRRRGEESKRVDSGSRINAHSSPCRSYISVTWPKTVCIICGRIQARLNSFGG